jgi:chemotaxis family two-component system sensor histidine kinase/response regulator PixL
VPQRFRTILVVEDDSDIREVTAEVLRAAGGTVLEAQDGADALTKLDELEGPCLIVLDLVMPRIDGLEFLKRLQAHPHAPDFSVVVMTARSDPIAIPGVLGVLRKPFDVAELVALLGKAA